MSKNTYLKKIIFKVVRLILCFYGLIKYILFKTCFQKIVFYINTKIGSQDDESGPSTLSDGKLEYYFNILLYLLYNGYINLF